MSDKGATIASAEALQYHDKSLLLPEGGVLQLPEHEELDEKILCSGHAVKLDIVNLTTYKSLILCQAHETPCRCAALPRHLDVIWVLVILQKRVVLVENSSAATTPTKHRCDAGLCLRQSRVLSVNTSFPLNSCLVSASPCIPSWIAMTMPGMNLQYPALDTYYSSTRIPTKANLGKGERQNAK